MTQTHPRTHGLGVGGSNLRKEGFVSQFEGTQSIMEVKQDSGNLRWLGTLDLQSGSGER